VIEGDQLAHAQEVRIGKKRVPGLPPFCGGYVGYLGWPGTRSVRTSSKAERSASSGFASCRITSRGDSPTPT
jgi:hypothetical protein